LVRQKPFLALLPAGAVGSAIGGLLPYGLGRAGGELFLLKHVNRKHYEKIRTRFERQEFLAMMIPSMLPPPTPWKACVFAAGVFEMRIVAFMLAVFSGRMVRWLVLSVSGHQAGSGRSGRGAASRTGPAGHRRRPGSDRLCLVVDAEKARRQAGRLIEERLGAQQLF
jgi:membrane protein YqaA with SNARE-associated domain